MSKPHLARFIMPNGQELTTVVLDEDEFNEFADSLHGIAMINEDNERAADTQIEAIKAARILPMVARGSKTEFVFEKYGIETDAASFIVRGQGEFVFNQLAETVEEDEACYVKITRKPDDPSMPGPPSQK